MDDETIRPFSNGTSRCMWMEGNCWGGCVKAVDEGDETKPFRCAIQSALSLSSLTGTIPDRIAKRAGFDDPHLDGYFPCKEFSDDRTPAVKRGRRQVAGQEGLQL